MFFSLAFCFLVHNNNNPRRHYCDWPQEYFLSVLVLLFSLFSLFVFLSLFKNVSLSFFSTWENVSSFLFSQNCCNIILENNEKLKKSLVLKLFSLLDWLFILGMVRERERIKQFHKPAVKNCASRLKKSMFLHLFIFFSVSFFCLNFFILFFFSVSLSYKLYRIFFKTEAPVSYICGKRGGNGKWQGRQN